MERSLARLVFTIRLTDDAPGPYALFGLRNPFREAFRSLSCHVKSDAVCDRCRVPTCPFYAVYSQKVAEDQEAKRRYQKPPLPFVFEFPVITPEAGAVFSVALTVVGSALPHIGVFVQAFRSVLATGELRGEILAIKTLSRFGEESPLFPSPGLPAQPVLLALDDFFHETSAAESGAVTFLSPVRLVSNGRETSQFDFPLFLRTLLRRVSSILYYYCGIVRNDDFRWLSERCGEVSVITSRFSSERACGGLPGLIGSVTFRGDLSEILPYLLLGEYLNAGKGASFGYGSFRLRS